ncbi:MAG: hypothetical protein AAB412_05215, partial [Elusimicrobiota bacterium]
MLWAAEFVIDDLDAGMRDALEAAAGPFDARVVSSPWPTARLSILPGAVFHPADAAEPIRKVLAEAQRGAMARDDVLDALLRMERSLRSL